MYSSSFEKAEKTRKLSGFNTSDECVAFTLVFGFRLGELLQWLFQTVSQPVQHLWTFLWAPGWPSRKGCSGCGHSSLDLWKQRERTDSLQTVAPRRVLNYCQQVSLFFCLISELSDFPSLSLPKGQINKVSNKLNYKVSRDKDQWQCSIPTRRCKT